MISPPDLEDSRVKFWRNVRFTCYCARDISVVLLAAHVFIIFCSFLVYSGDKKRHTLIHFLHFDDFPKCFYYLCGVLAFFACIGLCFLVGIISHRATNSTTGLCTCHDPNSPNCCICCEVTPRHQPCYCIPSQGCCDGCICCESGSACECGACECGSCCDTAGASACEGEGAMVFGLVIVVILAVVGIFICAIVGMKGVKEISERHVHILRKRTLVNDFIVCDLAHDSDYHSTDIEMGAFRGSGGGNYDRISNFDSENSEINYFSAQQQRTLDRMGLI